MLISVSVHTLCIRFVGQARIAKLWHEYKLHTPIRELIDSGLLLIILTQGSRSNLLFSHESKG